MDKDFYFQMYSNSYSKHKNSWVIRLGVETGVISEIFDLRVEYDTDF